MRSTNVLTSFKDLAILKEKIMQLKPKPVKKQKKEKEKKL